MIQSKEVLKLLKEGKSIQEIAQISNTTIPNIKSHVKRLREKGLWKPLDNPLQWSLDFDQTLELLIQSLEQAKTVPELMKRINQLENQKAALENELVALREEVKITIDRERRYRLAIQQGEINSPISDRK